MQNGSSRLRPEGLTEQSNLTQGGKGALGNARFPSTTAFSFTPQLPNEGITDGFTVLRPLHVQVRRRADEDVILLVNRPLVDIRLACVMGTVKACTEHCRSGGVLSTIHVVDERHLLANHTAVRLT